MPSGATIDVSHESLAQFLAENKRITTAYRDEQQDDWKEGSGLISGKVDAAILLTQPPSKVKRLAGRQVRGVMFHTLKQWKDAIGFDGPRVLTARQVTALSRALAPKSAVAVDGSLRRLAGYVNLELQTPKEQRDHRVYKGSHPARRDRVVLHLYDLSADDNKNAEAKAKREADALGRLQLYPWAPRILDSWQDAPGYAGEMFFITVVDPAAPCIEDRANDASWNSTNRLLFARDAIRALNELHQEGAPDEPLVHRNLTPQTILVRHDNSPIFTGIDRTKIPFDISVASSSLPASPRNMIVLGTENRRERLRLILKRRSVRRYRDSDY